LRKVNNILSDTHTLRLVFEILTRGHISILSLTQIVLSSTSDYVSSHINIPVAIVKPRNELNERTSE
jgi:hypothetical protein